jgi:hypothetical protein
MELGAKMQPGLFDVQLRFEKTDKNGDTLHQLNDVIDRESFLMPVLYRLPNYATAVRKAEGARKGKPQGLEVGQTRAKRHPYPLDQ